MAGIADIETLLGGLPLPLACETAAGPGAAVAAANASAISLTACGGGRDGEAAGIVLFSSLMSGATDLGRTSALVAACVGASCTVIARHRRDVLRPPCKALVAAISGCG